MFEGFDGQIKAGCLVKAACVVLQLFQHWCVVFGTDHDPYEPVVLGRSAKHGGPADIDIFDCCR